MLLPSGCQAWPSSRGSVLQKQELGARGQKDRAGLYRAAVRDQALPDQLCAQPAAVQHCGRGAGGAHTGMLPACPGQRKTTAECWGQRSGSPCPTAGGEYPLGWAGCGVQQWSGEELGNYNGGCWSRTRGQR